MARVAFVCSPLLLFLDRQDFIDADDDTVLISAADHECGGLVAGGEFNEVRLPFASTHGRRRKLILSLSLSLSLGAGIRLAPPGSICGCSFV